MRGGGPGWNVEPRLLVSYPDPLFPATEPTVYAAPAGLRLVVGTTEQRPWLRAEGRVGAGLLRFASGQRLGGTWARGTAVWQDGEGCRVTGRLDGAVLGGAGVQDEKRAAPWLAAGTLTSELEVNRLVWLELSQHAGAWGKPASGAVGASLSGYALVTVLLNAPGTLAMAGGVYGRADGGRSAVLPLLRFSAVLRGLDVAATAGPVRGVGGVSRALEEQVEVAEDELAEQQGYLTRIRADFRSARRPDAELSISAAHLYGNLWCAQWDGYRIRRRNALLFQVDGRLRAGPALLSLSARPALDLDSRPAALIGDSVKLQADFRFLNERLRSILSLEWGRFLPVDPEEPIPEPGRRLRGGRVRLVTLWRPGRGVVLSARAGVSVDPAFSALRFSAGVGVSATKQLSGAGARGVSSARGGAASR